MPYAFQDDENNQNQQTNIFDAPQNQAQGEQPLDSQVKTQAGGDLGMGSSVGGESGPKQGPMTTGNIFKANAGKQAAPKYLQNTFAELNKKKTGLESERSNYLNKQSNFTSLNPNDLKNQIARGNADWDSIRKEMQGGRRAESFTPTQDYSSNQAQNLMSNEGLINVLRQETGGRNYSGGEAKLDARLLRKNKAFQDEVARLGAEENEFNTGLNDYGARAQAEADAKIKQREMENRNNLSYALENIKKSLIGENKKEAEQALKSPANFSKEAMKASEGFNAKNKGQSQAREQALSDLLKKSVNYGSRSADYKDFLDEKEAGILNNLASTLGLKDIYTKGGGLRSNFDSAKFAKDLGLKTDQIYGANEQKAREQYNKLISGIDNIDDSEIANARKSINAKLDSKYNTEEDYNNLDALDVDAIAEKLLSEKNPYFKSGRGNLNQAQADEINQLAQMYGFDPIDVAGTGIFDEQGYESELERRMQEILNPPEIPNMLNREDLVGRIL